ncbi:MAG: amino acid adenylation domain-containing protein, partial [Acidimicrobiales bacterium]
IEMVVAVVGTILAGGAYVPLDPRFPPPRLALMLDVSEAPVVLTVSDARDNVLNAVRSVKEERDVKFIDVADIDPVLGQPNPDDLTVSPENTLLLTFTSGSTGVPKGVRIHHAGMLSRLEWQWDAYPLEPGEVSPQKTTLGFADHLWELWGALLHGNPVLLIDDDVVTDPDALIETLAAYPIRRLTLVPSLLDLLLEHAPDIGELLPRLTMWTSSGEALAAVTADRFAQLLPGRKLINLYGMSEVSPDATVAEVTPDQDLSPIGRTIANMGVRVLDQHDRQVPVGVPGELHVSGVGVSPGYWNRPDLTAERFVPNPFANGNPDHDRLYRSGDMARWRDDGVLDYLGRTDHQVKVRGVRIELGEVETALASFPGVDRAVVGGRTTAVGNTLVAYVTALDDTLNPDQLVEHARSLLPEVMVPSQAVVLDHFPLLPNGKVNRHALPDPTPRKSAAPVRDFDLTEPEVAMLALWREVMEQPSLGPDDDFFDAGGHSMLAMRLVSRIRKDLGLQVGLSQLLRTGTPRSLVAGNSAAETDEHAVELHHLIPILEPDPDLRNIFMVHGAGGDILTFQPVGRYLAGRYNVWGVQAAGVDGVSPLHQSREQVVSSYLDEIRQVQPAGPYLLAGFSMGGVIGSELVKRLRADGEDVDALVLFDTFLPTLIPRDIPLTEHLGKLFRVGPQYGLGKVRDKIETRRLNRARERNRIESPEGPISFEVRKWEITTTLIEMWSDYRVGPVDVPVIMLSTEAVSDIWEGVIDDSRGWQTVASDLRVTKVPGGHLTLLEEPHARIVAERLADALEA